MINIFSKIRTIGRRLLVLGDNEPLSFLSIFVILMLDIYVLTSIFSGLENQAEMLDAPHEYIPNECRQIIIHGSWSNEKRIDNLSDHLFNQMRTYNYRDQKDIEYHHLCAGIMSSLESLEENDSLLQLFDRRRVLQRDYSVFDQYKKQRHPVRIDSIATSIERIDREINEMPEVAAFWKQIESSRQHKDKLIRDIREMEIWYPIKRLLLEMAFLIPLMVVFYLLYGYGIKREKNFLVLVSSHLLAVSFIPALIKIIQAIYDIIPKKLLREFIEFLESIHLISIWYYIVIALGVIASIFLIYLLQKKIFSRDRLILRRVSRYQCISCGKGFSTHDKFCTFCGSNRFTDCPHCGQETFLGGIHCVNCGENIL